MITKEMIDRINHLAKKSKLEGLTDSEREEQQKLRSEYVAFIKGQVRQQLECIEFVEDQKKPDCGCGHSHDVQCKCGCKKH